LADRSYLIALGHYHFEREASAAARPRRAREGDLLTPARLRVIRALLCHPTRAWDQIALAQKTRVSVGTVNALVNRLVDRKYGERRGGKEGKGPDQKFHLLQARELLDEWAEYWPRVTRLRHRYYARYGTVPQFAAELSRIAREIHDEEVSDHLTKRLWETPSTKSPEWRDALARGILENTAPFALTGLAAASFVEDFVRFTMIEAYATVDLDRLAQRAGLRAVEDEPNVVLIEPPDYGLLTETTTVGDVPIVCLAQLYVDLIAAGGRAAGEAAPLIRSIALGGPR
jgi:DNA-binding MarR family transcriptional regulator